MLRTALVLVVLLLTTAAAQTHSDPPPPEIADVAVVAVTDSTAQITWRIVPSGQGEPQSHVAYWKDGDSSLSHAAIQYGNGTQTSNLTGLRPGTAYGFFIAAQGSGGPRQSDHYNFTTSPSTASSSASGTPRDDKPAPGATIVMMGFVIVVALFGRAKAR